MVARIEDAVELRWVRHSEKGAWLKLEAGPERWGRETRARAWAGADNVT